MPEFLKRLVSRSSHHKTEEDSRPRPEEVSGPPSYTSNPPTRAASPSAHHEDAPPPPFTFPASYPVGQHGEDHTGNVLFIARSDVQAHVRLLAAFDKLRQAVEAHTEGVTAGLDPASRWAVFIEIAIYRFELFLRAQSAMGADGDADHVLPPLDVAMVLHTYMTNPFRFNEDRLRIWPVLERLSQSLLRDVAFAVDGSSLQLLVSATGKSAWSSLTNSPFDPLENLSQTRGRATPDIAGFPSVDVPWLAEDATGYAQQGFRAETEGLVYTHASLGIAKLASDVIRCKPDPLMTLANTVITPWYLPKEPVGSGGARWVATRLARAPVVQRAETGQDLAAAWKYDRNTVEDAFKTALGITKQHGIDGLLSSYRRGEPFSLDLAPSVLRQTEFSRSLRTLGWFEPGRLDEDTATLDRLIARYHGFMDLIAADPYLVAIPTMDVELAWQTHMLKRSYLTDMKQEVGRLVDHDMAIEESVLARLFAETSDAWIARFKVPYSCCACTASKTGGHSKRAISALRSHIRGNTSSADVDTRAEYNAEGFSDSTVSHPSELLCVTYVKQSDLQRERQKRLKSAASRRKAAVAQSEAVCSVGGTSGDAYLKAIPEGVHYGLSGYASPEPQGPIVHADLADPSAVPGPEAFGPFAKPALGKTAAAFRPSGKAGLGPGWEGLMMGSAMGAGIGGFAM
ncbi:hypothetical protein JCM8202_002849 [Rhodotorula sphaerocarpa]